MYPYLIDIQTNLYRFNLNVFYIQITIYRQMLRVCLLAGIDNLKIDVKTLRIDRSVIDFASILYLLRFNFDNNIEQTIFLRQQPIVSIGAHI